ncbi:MAG: efflux RND transporter permease subunit [Parabacteroides merdae]
MPPSTKCSSLSWRRQPSSCCVIFLFLQNFRAVIIPCITIPVSLIGTLAVMSALGFSINTLTLFGLILAIAIVVDDAIVVVENSSRLMDTGNIPPVKP